MGRILEADIESFSDVDLVKCGVYALEVHADPAIAPGIHLRLVKDGLYVFIHHLRRLLAVGVEEPMRTALLLRFCCLPIPLTEGKHRS